MMTRNPRILYFRYKLKIIEIYIWRNKNHTQTVTTTKTMFINYDCVIYFRPIEEVYTAQFGFKGI